MYNVHTTSSQSANLKNFSCWRWKPRIPDRLEQGQEFKAEAEAEVEVEATVEKRNTLTSKRRMMACDLDP